MHTNRWILSLAILIPVVFQGCSAPKQYRPQKSKHASHELPLAAKSSPEAPSDAPWAPPRPACPELPAEPATALQLTGLRLRPVVSVYLLNRDMATVVRARISERPAVNSTNRALLRAYDTEERLTHWVYNQSNLDAPITHPADPYASGLPTLALPPSPDKHVPLQDSQLVLVEPGVHQIRAGVDTFRAQLDLACSNPLEWGISFQNGDWALWPDAPKTLYAYIPPRATVLHLQLLRGAMRVTDDHGATILDATKKGKHTLNVERTGVVWTFEFANAGTEIKAHGLPLILCSSKQAAEEIRASVELLPDGTVVAHKFQRAIAEFLPKLLAPENIGTPEDLIVPLASLEDAWMADVPRNHILMCGYSTFIRGIAHALRQQNTDPASRWSGLFSDYTPPEGVAPADYRWDTFLPVTGIGGCRKVETAAYGLAKAATLDVPVNPYFGRKELLMRAAAASLRDLMVMNEAEVWPRAAAHWYPSSMSFVMGNKTLPPFGLAAPLLPDDVRALWTTGLRRMVDRVFPDHLVSARNQSSHCLVSFAHFANGTEDPVYHRLARLYAAHFAAGANAPGYHMEACGPDASYIGMTHWFMGMYYRLSGDRDFLPAIAKSYRFFNHTVAPEPDGKTILGGYNFGHRVGMGFFEEQYGGSKGILYDVIPEVGVWAPADPSGDLEKKAKDIRKQLARKHEKFPGRLTDPRFEYFTTAPKRKPWPAQESERFIHNIENELIAVRRPGYYMAVYVGKPAGKFYIRQREKFRSPLANNAETEGGQINVRSITPFLGGGLTLFWTPDYGTSLMATNWSALTHHGMVATTDQQKRYWEDYHATSFEIDEAANTLTIRGKIESLPVKYERRYTFHDDRLDIALTLTPEKDVQLERLIENIPVVGGRSKPETVALEAPARSNEIRIQDTAAQTGVTVTFNSPHPMHVCTNGPMANYRKYQINRVEVELPARLTAGTPVELGYTLRPGGATSK